MLDDTSRQITSVFDSAQTQVSEIKLDGSENKANAGVFRELWKEV